MSATTVHIKETKPNYLNVSDTVLSWLLTTDHKRIALLYLTSLTFFSCVAAIATGIVHMGLLTPQGGGVSPSNYQQSVTMHGVITVFFLLITAVPGVLGNFVLPLMIGARNLASPRLNLASWYLYVIGGAMVLWAAASGEIDALWTFPLLSATSGIPLAVLGLLAAVLSSAATSLNVILTIHKMRAPGLTWLRLPLFVWAHYAFSISFLVGIFASMFSLVLAIQGSFVSRGDGTTLFTQPLFWVSFHPAIFVTIVPAMGIVSEVIACFSRQRIFGYPFAVLSILTIPVLTFLGWGQYFLAEGEITFANMLCSLGNVLVAALMMVQVFLWVITIRRGVIDLRAPMLYALGCSVLLAIGGMTGLFLAALPTSVHLKSTFFALAHLHTLVAGGTLFGFLAGLHFWWAKITGRMYPEFWAKVATIVTFAGVNTAFCPHLILGLMGMPPRYQRYPEGFQPLHVISTAGMLVLFTGYAITAAYLLWSLRYGQAAGSNPWRAAGLEWKTESPPVAENFAETPVVAEEPYDYERNPS